MAEKSDASRQVRPAPESPSRRALLIGAGLAGGAVALPNREASAQAAPAAAAHDGIIANESLRADHSHDAQPHDFDDSGTSEVQPFYGLHQSGIVNPQPAAAIIAAFDVLASDREELQRLFRMLTDRAIFLTRGGPVPATDPRMPPPDTGLLGADIPADNLTMTVAVGASLFDSRFGLADLKPEHLAAMEQFPNDALDPDHCHGDLLIQFCANTAETNLHALRDVIKSAPDLLAIRWKIAGFLPPHTLKKLGQDTFRNLMGFKDGTANINARDVELMNDLVWVRRQSAEPEWARGGSYQVVRLIRMMVERWDRTPLGEQETIMGREKISGAPLGMKNEHDIPNYGDAAQGCTVPEDAHIRLANPRLESTQANLILRRAYNYSREVTKAGQLDMGLAFICFQADLNAGFKTVQTRLNGEKLEEYIKPFGGGYFFALPGVRDSNDYLAKDLVERRFG